MNSISRVVAILCAAVCVSGIGLATATSDDLNSETAFQPDADSGEISQRDRMGRFCFCDVLVEAPLPAYPIRKLVDNWLLYLQQENQTIFTHYIGKGVPGHSGGQRALRFLIIAPSEYFRDSEADWDFFYLVLVDDDSRSPFRLVTKNYRFRGKGHRSEPSPNWEYFSLDDIDTTNGRLATISFSLKRVVELLHQPRAQPPS